MKQFALFAFLAAAALLAGCGKKEPGPQPAKPSRAAADGCEWATFEAPGLGVSLLYEKCQTERFTFAEDANAIVMRRAEDGAAWPIVEVFTKREMQPVEGAIREQFISALDDKERLGCVIAPSPQVRVDGLRTLEIVPGPQYAAEVAKRREKEPVSVCGDYGDAMSLRFFVYQPEVTKTRFAFVNAGKDRPLFDETSIRMLPDTVANAAVKDLPITSLPLAERYAAGIETRLDKLAKKTGEYHIDDDIISWAAFRDGSQIVLIVEMQEKGDNGSGSFRYFFRGGELALVRETSLGPTPSGRQRHTQVEILKALAFGPGGKLVGGRKTVNGKAGIIESAEEEAARARAADLMKRAAGA